MPTPLSTPLKVEEFAHADANAVRYDLDDSTGLVYVQPVGAACKVSTSSGQAEGVPITINFVPIDDGGLEDFRFTRPDEPARVPGRFVYVAMDAPGIVKFLSSRAV